MISHHTCRTTASFTGYLHRKNKNPTPATRLYCRHSMCTPGQCSIALTDLDLDATLFDRKTRIPMVCTKNRERNQKPRAHIVKKINHQISHESRHTTLEMPASKQIGCFDSTLIREVSNKAMQERPPNSFRATVHPKLQTKPTPNTHTKTTQNHTHTGGRARALS